jgi:hypothetical protein
MVRNIDSPDHQTLETDPRIGDGEQEPGKLGRVAWGLPSAVVPAIDGNVMDT